MDCDLIVHHPIASHHPMVTFQVGLGESPKRPWLFPAPAVLFEGDRCFDHCDSTQFPILSGVSGTGSSGPVATQWSTRPPS